MEVRGQRSQVRCQRAEVCYRELMMSGCDCFCFVSRVSELGILASPLREHGNRSVALAELAEARKKLRIVECGFRSDS